ncbi:MAG: hypothetical protein BGO78_00540 [Chloroflexi bacterium 44-23]|nr:MAG: hypothetical protein BGO78_00540 [Chloroflexi bacterium 44-23]
MEKIQEFIKRPLIAAALGFVLGLIIGLPILGWGLMPVQWKDADPSYLRADIKSDYFCMVADSFARNGDAVVAKSRLEGLGSYSEAKLNSLLPNDCGLTSEEINTFKTALGAVTAPLPGADVAPQPGDKEKSGASPFLLVGLFCLVTVVIGGALAYLFLVKNKKPGTSPTRVQPVSPTTEVSQQDQYATDETSVSEPPVAQFMSTYVAGDDLYDDSFSIDSPSGEFLGECGVSISEIIGVGDPKKVTAIETWLFDKNDIETVTKVLMSQHAYDDPALSQRLASKGEPVLIQPGGRVVLESETLQMEARVVDIIYAQGALPEGSVIDRITIELAIWQK